MGWMLGLHAHLKSLNYSKTVDDWNELLKADIGWYFKLNIIDL